jgi:hypothetical protein
VCRIAEGIGTTLVSSFRGGNVTVFLGCLQGVFAPSYRDVRRSKNCEQLRIGAQLRCDAGNSVFKAAHNFSFSFKPELVRASGSKIAHSFSAGMKGGPKVPTLGTDFNHAPFQAAVGITSKKGGEGKGQRLQSLRFLVLRCFQWNSRFSGRWSVRERYRTTRQN